MRLILTSIFLNALALPLAAADIDSAAVNAPLTAPQAAIQFAQGGLYEFGNVSEGDIVRHSFTFTNTGNATLQIHSVNTTCSCTTVEDWSKEVAPGKTGTISLKINSNYLSGSVEKSAIILCNDPQHSQTMVEMKGVVLRPIVVSPQTLTLNIVSGTTNSVSGAVNILDNEEQSLTLSQLQCDNPYFVPELKNIRDGREYRLFIHTEPSQLSGNLHGRILMKTSLADKPQIEINVFAAVQPAVMVMPSQIFLNQTAGQPTVEMVCIVNNEPDSIVISDAKINADVDVQIQNTVPGHQFLAKLTFPPNYNLSPNDDVEFSVKTSNPNYPVIKVPIHHPTPGPTLP